MGNHSHTAHFCLHEGQWTHKGKDKFCAENAPEGLWAASKNKALWGCKYCAVQEGLLSPSPLPRACPEHTNEKEVLLRSHKTGRKRDLQCLYSNNYSSEIPQVNSTGTSVSFCAEPKLVMFRWLLLDDISNKMDKQWVKSSYQSSSYILSPWGGVSFPYFPIQKEHEAPYIHHWLSS